MMPGVDQDGLAKTAERVRMLIENSVASARRPATQRDGVDRRHDDGAR